jgi:hypothetical protein
MKQNLFEVFDFQRLVMLVNCVDADDTIRYVYTKLQMFKDGVNIDYQTTERNRQIQKTTQTNKRENATYIQIPNATFNAKAHNQSALFSLLLLHFLTHHRRWR